MVGVFNTQAMPRWQQSDKPFGSGIADDPVLSCRHHQDRRMNALREPRLLEGFDRFEGGGQPSIRNAGDRQLRIVPDRLADEVKPRLVMGQPVAGKGFLKGIIAPQRRNIGKRPASSGQQPAIPFGQGVRDGTSAESDHRGQQDRLVDAPGIPAQTVQNDSGSHGMGHEDQRASGIGPYDFIEKQF